jgi:error-prone DNA polymerase
VPMVATNDVHYHEPGRRQLQDVLTCIREKCTIQTAGFRLHQNAERHLKSPTEMARLFANAPDAFRRTVEVADRCTFSLDELRYEYPEEPVPEGLTAQQRLAELTWEGAAERFSKSPSPPFRGEREGPIVQRWEGEVGSAVGPAHRPPHPALSPGQRGRG